MGWGNRVAGSDPSQGGVYFDAGVYPLVEVDALKFIKSRKDEELFVAEFNILESEVESRPAGTKASWICNFRHDAAPGNVKAFLAAASGGDVEDVTEEVCDAAVSEANPFNGRRLRLEASMIETKKKNPFTLHKWIPLGDEHQTA